MEDKSEGNKVSANEEDLVKAVVGLCPAPNEGGQGGAPLPLFLTETELNNQGNPYAWRKGVADTTSNIFRTPRSTPEFPRIFQNAPKRAPMKALPFTYKAFQKKVETEVKPTITIPVDTEEPAYAPTTP